MSLTPAAPARFPPPVELPGEGGPPQKTEPPQKTRQKTRQHPDKGAVHPGACRTCRTNSRLGAGSCPSRETRHQLRRSGVPGAGSSASTPRPTSRATASREISVTPSPAATDSQTATLHPTVSVPGAICNSSRYASVVARVPDPGSRSSHVCPAKKAAENAAEPEHDTGPTTTSSLGRTACATIRGHPGPCGGRPPSTRSTWCSAASPSVRSRLPTSRWIPIRGYRTRNEASNPGSSCSPAVVTAATRSTPPPASPAAAERPSSSRPSTPRTYPAETEPASVRRSPRPFLANRASSRSFCSAVTQDDTADSVTTSRSA